MSAASVQGRFAASFDSGWLVPVIGCSVGSVALGKLATEPSTLRLGAAAATGALVIGLGIRAPRTLLVLLIAWLAVLGLLRRIASGWADFGTVDPLLLVAPLAFVVLLVAAVESGALQRRSKLANGVLVLSALLVLGALNPLQGSLVTGAAGLLFTLVPVLAFWVGRGLCDDLLFERILKVVALLGIGAALYGLSQTFRGFPSWDSAWIEERGYAALNVGGAIRPFSTFSSAAEYGFFLAIGILVWVVVALKSRRAIVGLSTIPLVCVALLLESSRGIVILLLLALALMLFASRRVPLPAAIVVAGCLVAAVPFVASRVVPANPGSDPGSALLSHQALGLANPLNPESSTLLVHMDLVEKGLRSALENPIGVGIGPVTIAGEKFGEGVQGTEADPSNVAVSLGLPGLLAYLFIVFVGMRRAYEVATRRSDVVSLVALGVLIATLAQWLNGGQYAVAFLPWLVLGWLDRANVRGT